MAEERIWTAALLVIGDEILSGRTQDRNVAQVAKWLNLQGIRLAEVRVVPDVVERIAEAVNALRGGHDYLFTTGGIGPTHDDITVDSIARALGVPVVVHPKARAILEAYYAGRGGLTEARLRMARVPQGAELIENPTSGAPGIRVGNIFLLAGVPHIATVMLEALSGTLEGGRPILSRTIGSFTPESEVADMLAEVEAAHPGTQIGSYPFFKEGRIGANFVVRAVDESLLDACAAELARRLREAGREVRDEVV
jgi:molybdenum cofactor synthesis domain-containing protein